MQSVLTARTTAVAAWLDINRIRSDLVAAILGGAAPLDAGAAPPEKDHRFAVRRVRELCADAFAAAWPLHAEVARRVCTDAPTWFVAQRGARPQTRDAGPRALPSIIVPWRTGSAEEALSLVHELAHAVQIVATHVHTPGATMPPVAREVCAFLGERAVLRHLSDGRERRALRAAWIRDDRTYLVADAQRLRAALASGGATYDYRWNYPVARWIARRSAGLAEPNTACALLESGPDAPTRLEPHILDALASRNPLPPIVGRDEAGPMAAYRRIGVAAALETAAKDLDGETVQGFYAAIVGALRDGGLVIGVDEEARPFGWGIASRAGESAAGNERLAAPFGDRARMEALISRRASADANRGGHSP
ncbi:hypothetical protein [Salinarimonas chemoclinalis]|uniref:hypothetical protein n=1 Tax=Salinarimonas chemoclinalis TaxID=3241599 RepID=UPI003558A240